VWTASTTTDPGGTNGLRVTTGRVLALVVYELLSGRKGITLEWCIEREATVLGEFRG
jgi:hypothetical protein